MVEETIIRDEQDSEKIQALNVISEINNRYLSFNGKDDPLTDDELMVLLYKYKEIYNNIDEFFKNDIQLSLFTQEMLRRLYDLESMAISRDIYDPV